MPNVTEAVFAITVPSVVSVAVKVTVSEFGSLAVNVTTPETFVTLGFAAGVTIALPVPASVTV